MTTTEVASPIWYRVTKCQRPYSTTKYELTYMDAHRIQRYKPHGRWVFEPFQTRDEAIAYAEARGWIKVSTWKEARELAKPYIAALRAAKEESARQYDLTLHTTPEAVAAEVAELAAGGEALRVWVGVDGILRAKKVNN